MRFISKKNWTLTLALLTGCTPVIDSEYNPLRNENVCNLRRNLVDSGFIEELYMNLISRDSNKIVLLAALVGDLAPGFKMDNRLRFTIVTDQGTNEELNLTADIKNLKYVNRAQYPGFYNYSLYTLSFEDLKKIAKAKSVSYALETDRSIKTGVFTQETIAKFREYKDEYQAKCYRSNPQP